MSYLTSSTKQVKFIQYHPKDAKNKREVASPHILDDNLDWLLNTSRSLNISTWAVRCYNGHFPLFSDKTMNQERNQNRLTDNENRL